MKLRVLAILGGVLVFGCLSAQTMTDVINEFNAGVDKVNTQEYDVSIDHFNKVISMAATVGDEANDLKMKSEEQIPQVYYRQATVFMKNKQYDKAIPFLEKTVEFASLYHNNEDIRDKASGYLPQLYVVEGNREWKNQSFDAALANFDKALALNEELYQAYQGKGMVYLDQDETDKMLEAFARAKEGAQAKNDTKTIDQVNDVIDSYFNKFITQEMASVDPEESDYTFVVEACTNALAANPSNPRALYHMAVVANKTVQYDNAVDYSVKALQYEKDPVWISAINFELGTAYQNSAAYDQACETLKKVTEEPFLSRAESKMASVCN
jgi:tetratricopeptide (TPR) repeat protein